MCEVRPFYFGNLTHCAALSSTMAIMASHNEFRVASIQMRRRELQWRKCLNHFVTQTTFCENFQLNRCLCEKFCISEHWAIGFYHMAKSQYRCNSKLVRMLQICILWKLMGSAKLEYFYVNK